MKNIYKKAIEQGKILKYQSFETSKGLYTLFLVNYKDDIFFFKYKDGDLCECCNLSKIEGI
jgi:hypothetical protein